MTERFWVYDNWTSNKARVHLASCRYCRDGAGVNPEKGPSNSRWMGPYETVDEAEAAARSYERKSMSLCPLCLA